MGETRGCSAVHRIKVEHLEIVGVPDLGPWKLWVSRTFLPDLPLVSGCRLQPMGALAIVCVPCEGNAVA